MTRNKKIMLVFLIAVMILSGYLRDYLFLNLNEQIRVTFYKSPESFVSPSLSFLNSFSYPQLYYGKWFLTFFFAFVFLGFSILIIHLLFIEKKYITLTFMTYFAILAISFLFFAGGYFSGTPEKGYRFARILMGLAQSPVIVMVLVPAFFLLKKGTHS